MLIGCIYCSEPMVDVDRFDTGSSYAPDGRSYCYNLWMCIQCGAVARQSIWDKPGTTWLTPLYMEGDEDGD